MSKRKFIIEVIKNDSVYGYIKYIYKNKIGKFYEITFKKENAKFWKYKKNCEKYLDNIKNNLDPTKKNLKKYTHNIIEVTDDKILRKIKLEKINKKLNF